MRIQDLFRRRSPTAMLASCLCSQAQLESDLFQGWVARLHEPPLLLHRKIWEFCYIAQALHERDMLRPGRRGLGFAVGREPLTSLFVGLGCEVVATDLGTEEAQAAGWVQSQQHAASLATLNERGLCPAQAFAARVRFRAVDMRDIPSDLRDFDFLWSSCAMEHLGSIELGEQFVWGALRCLKPGGVAVHTTEFSLSSKQRTVAGGPTIFFQRRDIEGLARRLRAAGHRIELDLAVGHGPADLAVDLPPYPQKVHLRLQMGSYVVTSLGLIVQKSAADAGR